MAYIYDLTDTWNAGGTAFNAIKMNVTDSASAAGSKLVTLQTNGTEHFSVTKAGVGYFSGSLGIGTSSPGVQLQINGSQPQIQWSNPTTGATSNDGTHLYLSSSDFWLVNKEAAAMVFATDNTERARISAAGNTVIASDKFLNWGNEAQGFLGENTGGSLRAYTGYNERMRIDSSGNVGIGTSSPGGYKLAVTSASNLLALSDGSTQNLLVTVTSGAGSAGAFTFNANNGGQFIWQNAGAEKMRLDSSGNVGIGTAGPDSRLVVSDSAAIATLRVNTSNTGVSASNYSQIALSDVDSTRTWWRNVRDGSGKTAFGYNNHLAFLSDAGGTPTERARIDSSGNLLVGKTTATITDQGAEIKANGQINSALPTGSDFWNAYSTSAAAYRFYVTNGGTIYATSTSITAISDQRLKENVRDLDAGLDAVLALKPRRFDWKEGKGKDIKDDMGFIAQEVENVLPELIGGWKAGEGEPDDLKSVKAGDLIPVLVKAIQELTARVAQLEGN